MIGEATTTRRAFVSKGVLTAASVLSGCTLPESGADNSFRAEVGVAVERFGAIGDGFFDNAELINSAIRYLHDLGGGRLLFGCVEELNDYLVGAPLVCLPRVSLVGVGNDATLRSKRSWLSPYSGAVLLPGNFHPDLTAKARWYGVKAGEEDGWVSVASGPFAARAGDQVAVASISGMKMGGFFVPEYLILAKVSEVAGNKLLLDQAPDFAGPWRIALLRENLARAGRSLFFFSEAEIDNLTIISEGAWISDSATRGVRFKRLKVRARNGAYGNAFQKTRWEDCDFSFFGSACEQSHNSLDVVFDRCQFVYVKAAFPGPWEGISIQEFARNVRFEDCSLNLGEFPSGGPAVRILNTQNVVFERLKCTAKSMGSGSVVYMGHPGSDTFAVHGNRIRASSFCVGRAGRYIYANGGGSPFMHANGVERCQFYGKMLATDKVRVQDMKGSFSLVENAYNGGTCSEDT